MQALGVTIDEAHRPAVDQPHFSETRRSQYDQIARTGPDRDPQPGGLLASASPSLSRQRRQR